MIKDAAEKISFLITLVFTASSIIIKVSLVKFEDGSNKNGF